MPTIAEQNRKDTDLMYTLISEGKLDLMYLPAGVIAWLWDRPESQVNAARDLAVSMKDTCPVVDGALLRSDQNVLLLKCEDGHRFNVYPDGGYGCDGESLDLQGCMKMVDNGMEPVEAEECPMEGGGAPEPGVEFMTPDSVAQAAGAEVIATEQDGGTTEMDRDRQDRGVDLICKMRSVGSPLQKAMKAKEDVGDESKGYQVRWHGRDEPMKPLHGWDFKDEKDVIQARGKPSLNWRQYVKWYAEEGPALRIWVNGELVWDYENGWHESVDEAQGQQGVAGPIGTDMFGDEDEMAQIGAMVANEMRMVKEAAGWQEVPVSFYDEETDQEVNDVPVEVEFYVEPTELEGGYTFYQGGIIVENYKLGRDLQIGGKTFQAGTFPDELLEMLPSEVYRHKLASYTNHDAFADWLAEQLQAHHDISVPVRKYPRTM